MNIWDIALIILMIAIFGVDSWIIIKDFFEAYKETKELHKKNEEIIKKYKKFEKGAK